MNWTYLFVGLAVFGLGWVVADHMKAWPQDADERTKRASNLELGHMILLVGLFGLLAVWTNFAVTLLAVLVTTAVVPAVYRLFKPVEGSRPAVESALYWGFFPVILLVFVLRSFLFEPFKIPSGSMIPTLLVGDFILVNKYSYGVRLPVINKKIIETGSPQRGDVMVFRYPEDPSLDYIKRVAGVPGDKVAYQNKRLTINGEAVEVTRIDDYRHPERLYYSEQYEEKLGAQPHRMLNDTDAPAFIPDAIRFPYRENCLYNHAGVICTVPPGHYFMVGDNRDNSRDSRFWGFVPEENIVGKAFFIWLNFSDFSRIGSFK